MDQGRLEKKIKDYESFIEETLKLDLREVEKNLEKRASEHTEWLETKQAVGTLREFQAKDQDMPVRLDIGEGLMATAEVSDFDQTYVCIGLGCVLEMDKDEVDKYCDIRLKLLEREMAHFRKLAVEVKVHIKLTLLAINELRSIK